jgi:hypothetical protein
MIFVNTERSKEQISRIESMVRAEKHVKELLKYDKHCSIEVKKF